MDGYIAPQMLGTFLEKAPGLSLIGQSAVYSLPMCSQPGIHFA